MSFNCFEAAVPGGFIRQRSLTFLHETIFKRVIECNAHVGCVTFIDSKSGNIFTFELYHGHMPTLVNVNNEKCLQQYWIGNMTRIVLPNVFLGSTKNIPAIFFLIVPQTLVSYFWM